jgi:hypothetical protein
MMSEEQIRVSERRHFIDSARNLAQSSDSRSQQRRGRRGSYVERDWSWVAIILAFVLPGLLLGAWSAKLYLTDGPTEVQSLLYQNGLFLPHSRYAALEAAREALLQLPIWCFSAAISALLIIFAPLINLLRTVAR